MPQLKEQLESFNTDWDLISLDIDSRANNVTLLLIGIEDERTSVSGLKRHIVCSGLVNLNYSPHVLEPPPALIYKTVFDEVKTEADLKDHEGYWTRGKSFYDHVLPFYRLTIEAWEFHLEILCREIDVQILTD